MMVIGTCTIELHIPGVESHKVIPGNGSLKGKRRVVKSIIARVHNGFNASIAEGVGIRIGGEKRWVQS